MLLVPLTPVALAAQAATLSGYAELPADTFVPGPTSGQFIEAANGRSPPFTDRQPVQGFSALLKAADGAWLILSDNGFGSRENSPDYLLSIYRVTADFRTVNGGAGSIGVEGVIHLRDPGKFLPYPASREDRLLTGADLDPESFRRADDGSFWIGEEFIPSLLHFSADGELLAAPFRLDGLNSADNPQGLPASLPRSRGFEGMAISADGKWLYPMLEGALEGQERGLNIYTFDIENQRFVNAHANQPSYRYRLDGGATAAADFTMFSQSAGLVLERDSAEGEKAAIKKIYRVDFGQVGENGYLHKHLVADLLNIDDPGDLNRDGETRFSFPFWTIEGLVILNATTLGVVNDNNYPFVQARDQSGARPDGNEFILIEVPPLWK